jgi:hypothetical protein
MTSDWEYRERRTKWATALTSGVYPQGVGQLRNSLGSYCCLGVACEVFKNELGIVERRPGASIFAVGEDSSALVMPEPLRHYLAISLSDQSVLIALNDDQVPFGTIAKAVAHMSISRN